MAAALAAAGCAAGAPAATPTPAPTDVPSEITVINPPRAMTDFTLTDQAGQPAALHDLQGKNVLMSFGYTHCPDVCPITLARFKQIKAALGEMAEDIAFVWVSVDGGRDTPERVGQYLSMFDPAFVGLTGPSETVETIIAEYGGMFVLNNAGGLRRENYTVDHTASHFFLDTEGRWTRTYSYGSEVETIVGDLRQVLGSQ